MAALKSILILCAADNPWSPVVYSGLIDSRQAGAYTH